MCKKKTVRQSHLSADARVPLAPPGMCQWTQRIQVLGSEEFLGIAYSHCLFQRSTKTANGKVLERFLSFPIKSLALLVAVSQQLVKHSWWNLGTPFSTHL